MYNEELMKIVKQMVQQAINQNTNEPKWVNIAELSPSEQDD